MNDRTGPHPATPVLEIGGTHVTAALVDRRTGQVRTETVRRAELSAHAPAEDVIDRIVRCASSLRAAAGTDWGVALPGPFDYARGVALFTGVGKFDALRGMDVRRALLAGIAPRPGRLCFLNDAHAFALGEWAAGAAAGHTRAVGVTLGTGVGSAFLDAGALVDDGPDVPPHGHLHLLEVGGRPLEDTVSRRALLARYAARAATAPPDPSLDVSGVAARARAGDQAAREVFEGAMRTLGRTLRPWLDRFAATVVVVGGSIAGSWDLMDGPLREGVGKGRTGDAHAVAVPEVVPAARLHDAALVGAALYARDRPGRRGEAGGAGAGLRKEEM